jgi:hypothetical protein
VGSHSPGHVCASVQVAATVAAAWWVRCIKQAQPRHRQYCGSVSKAAAYRYCLSLLVAASRPRGGLGSLPPPRQPDCSTPGRVQCVHTLLSLTISSLTQSHICTSLANNCWSSQDSPLSMDHQHDAVGCQLTGLTTAAKHDPAGSRSPGTPKLHRSDCAHKALNFHFVNLD